MLEDVRQTSQTSPRPACMPYVKLLSDSFFRKIPIQTANPMEYKVRILIIRRQDLTISPAPHKNNNSKKRTRDNDEMVVYESAMKDYNEQLEVLLASKPEKPISEE